MHKQCHVGEQLRAGVAQGHHIKNSAPVITERGVQWKIDLNSLFQSHNNLLYYVTDKLH